MTEVTITLYGVNKNKSTQEIRELVEKILCDLNIEDIQIEVIS